MAIQPVVLGEPITGEGGDNYRQAHTKINANFVEVNSEISGLKDKNTLQDDAITSANNLAEAAIPSSAKGNADGVATLGSDGKVTPMQMPTLAQAQGQSTTQAVSQKLFTDTVGDIEAALTTINGA